MSSALLVFAATFLSVFTLGLQSLNVNQGHYLAAGVTSFFISTGHIFLYKFMPDSDVPQLVGYYLGAIAGITSSIWFHKRARALLAAWRSEGAFWPPRPPRSWLRRQATTCTRCCGKSSTSCQRADCPLITDIH